jgi:hypothetical protein
LTVREGKSDFDVQSDINLDMTNRVEFEREENRAVRLKTIILVEVMREDGEEAVAVAEEMDK